jgi:hypothetical protein
LLHSSDLAFYRLKGKVLLMMGETASGLAGYLGRRLGRLLSDQVQQPVIDGVHTIRGLSSVVSRAFLDAFLAEKIVAATWPSVTVLGAVASIHALSLFAVQAEAARVLIGMVVLAALGFSAYGIIIGGQVMLPHVRVWLVARLSPVRHARWLIFQWVRSEYSKIMETPDKGDFKQDILASAIVEFQRAQRLGANDVAFLLANDLAPVLVRHVLFRSAVLLGPLILAFLYYRLSIYPDIIARYTTIGPWRIALYPLAAAVDAVLQTHLRALLQLG